MIVHDLLALSSALLLLYLGTRLVRAAREGEPEAALELFTHAMRQGLWLAIIPALCELYIYLGLESRIGLEPSPLRMLLISAFVMLPVVLILRTASWIAFETILGAAAVVGVLREFMASDGFGVSLSDSRYLALVVFATIAASTLVVRGAITGWGRTGLGVLAGLAAIGGAVSFFSVTDFEAACFYITAAIAVGSGVLILVSDKIVHMAFWLLASLAGFASFYLLLGADFLGFTQVLVYIGGILILFLFGVMLTQRVDVPLKAAVSLRVLVPGVVIGVLTTGLLVFLAGGNNWSEKAAKDIAQISPNAVKVAEPTAFGLGEAFMSTYILPFEVVSVLLLVALVGATYIARGKSEGDSAGGADGEGGAA